MIFAFREADGEDNVVDHGSLHPAVQEGREALHLDLVERWITSLPHDVKRMYYIASGCDPRFKLFQPEQFPAATTEDLEQARNWFRSEYEMKWAPTQPAAKASQPTKQKLVGTSSRRVVSLGCMFFQNTTQPDSHTLPAFDPLSELRDYMSVAQEELDCDVLAWWASREKRFPNLSRMARQYLGIPASSAAVERLFSSAGRDFSKLRHSLKACTLENLMWARSYLKSNPVRSE